MTDLQRLLDTLPPGTEVAVALFRTPARGPSGGVEHHRGNGGSEASADPVAGTAVGLTLLGKEPDPEPRRPDETPLAAARRFHGVDPKMAQKVDVWATLLRYSERELRRALSVDVLESRLKGDGKDNRALVVPVESLVTYLSMVDAVTRGLSQTPGWWTDVRPAA